MNEHKGTTRRIGAGRRLLSNPRQARAALRAGFQSLPGMPIGQLFRRIPPVDSRPHPEPAAAQGNSEPGGPRLTIGNGASFAGYTILRQLGAGGMAEVYLALHPRLPRRDVIKVLAEAVTVDPEFRERFNREADLAATLWHPHIVGVHDRGEFNGHLWISMDYVEGTDASRLVKESYPDGMPLDEVSAIVQAVAGALDYAHARGLLHRDVKPANILLTHPEAGERRILLADFGVARHLGDISGITETNVAVGTVAYAAPEQLTGSPIDGRADQYALAATAFHLLTGAPPFQHSNPIAVIGQHLHEDPPRLSDFRPELAALDEVFCQALAKAPEDRFDQCRAFAAAVGRECDGAAAIGPDARSRTVASPAHRRRGPGRVIAAVTHRFSPQTRWAAALVCAVLVAVAATWSVLYSFQPGAPPANPALASKPSPPAAVAAPIAGGPVLNGTYKLDYDQTKRTTNGIGIRHDGAGTNWWAFRSACTSSGCAATGTRLDDTTHQAAGGPDGGPDGHAALRGRLLAGRARTAAGGLHPARRAGRGDSAGNDRLVAGAAERRDAARHRDRDGAQQRVRRSGGGGAGAGGGHPGRRRAAGSERGRSRFGDQRLAHRDRAGAAGAGRAVQRCRQGRLRPDQQRADRLRGQQLGQGADHHGRARGRQLV
nr:serine/threonine-protein kinase [Mycobacterium avium]